MECLKSENRRPSYKGKVIIMADKDRKMKKIIEALSIITAFGAVAIIVAFFLNMQNSINILIEKLDAETTKVETMYNHIYIDENSVNSQLASLHNDMDLLQNQLETIRDILNIKGVPE